MAAVGSTKEKRPQDWSAYEQLLALQTWCRERGLFAHHLAS
jgi:hypothetical protein